MEGEGELGIVKRSLGAVKAEIQLWECVWPLSDRSVEPPGQSQPSFPLMG